jgi:hypothetical protein
VNIVIKNVLLQQCSQDSFQHPMKPTFIALALMALCFSLTASAQLPKQWLGQWTGIV